MKIEKVEDSDISRLKELAKQSINLAVDAPEEVKPKIIKDVCSNIDAWSKNENCIFLKCIDNDEVVAFILIKEFWNLSDMFVLPGKLKKGIGRKLITQAMERCKELSDKSFIRVNSSLNAEGFYRSFGFVDIKLEKEIEDYVVPLIYRF